MRARLLQKGFSVIEIIVGSAIITIAGLAIILSTLSYIEISARNAKNVQASLLLEEASEALQFLRDISWTDNIAMTNTATTYYLEWDNGTYNLTTTPRTEHDIFTRTIEFSNIERDASDAISDSGTIDDNTRLATVTVSWTHKDDEESEFSEVLLHNTYDN